MILRKRSSGESVKRLQEGLAALGYHPGPIDGFFGFMVESAVCAFQKDNNLFEDGVFGEHTASVYNSMLFSVGKKIFTLFDSSNLKVEVSIDDRSIPLESRILGWKKCKADKFGDRGGYTRTTLRADVAVAYNNLYEEVHSLGGIITSAGGRRSLVSKASPSRSKKSMHYVGRAFDMALPTGMQNVNTDPYLIQKDSGRKWIVWCRTENSDFPIKKIKACTVYSKKNVKGRRYTQIKESEVSARVFNFTEIANKHGFNRISARRSFFSGGSYGGAEWWHFQWEKGLIEGVSTFGEELLKCYSREDAEKFVYWNSSKNARFGVNWF